MSRPIDDVPKRNQYRHDKFDGKKSIKDEYTGERIFCESRNAVHKHPTSKTTDNDHITPLEVIEKRYSHLAKEQQQAIANRDYNLALTNSKLNRSKGDLENHEYLLRQLKRGETENFKTSVNMLEKEVVSRTSLRVEAIKMTVENGIDNANEFIGNATNRFLDQETANINTAGIDNAIHAATFAATLAVTRNTVNVIRGDEGVDEAVKNVLVDTTSSAVIGYATGAIREKLALERSEAALIVTGTVQLSRQVFSYMSGEIDEIQLIENVAETTACLVAAYAGRIIGETIGNAVGPLGALVGGYVGEMVTTAVCSEVISTIKFNKEFDKNNNRLILLYHNAENEIRNSQARLEQIIQNENEELKKDIYAGFEDILMGIWDDSYEKIEIGLSTIGEKFNLSLEEIRKDKVTGDTLFQRVDEVLVIE